MNKSKVIFALLLLVCAASASAQDLLIQKDGSTILAKVIEVNPTDVKYKKFNNLEGPTYTILKADLFSINYESGERELITSTEAPVSQPTVSGQSAATAIAQPTYSTNNTLQNSLDYAKQVQIEDMQTSARRRKVWGFILTIGGGLTIATGILDFEDYEDLAYAEFAIGAAATGAGIGLLVSSKHKREEIQRLQFSSIPVKDYSIGNCTLSPSVNLMCDKTTFDKAVGAGVKITF